jgi:hypothetical protein
VHVLHLHICGLDFQTEPPFDCTDDYSGDVSFIKAAKFIGGRDAVEEYLACSMYPLSTNVSFKRGADGVTPTSRLKLPLPMFGAVHKDDEGDVQFLVRVELEAEGVVGSYTRPEHDTCIGGLRNGGRLNNVFELVGVAYRSHPVPGTDAFTEDLKKRKMDAAGKTSVKRVKEIGKKKGETVKIATPRGKTSLKRPSDVELASERPVK